MLWVPLIEETPNFARCFHSGVGLQAAFLYAVMIHPNLEQVRYKLRDNWCFFVIFFWAIHGSMSYIEIRNRYQDSVPRDKKLLNLLIGTIGLASSAASQLVAFLYVEENCTLKSLIPGVIMFTSCCGVLCFGPLILEQSYMCKFPARFAELSMGNALVALFVMTCSVFQRGQIACIVAVYAALIICFLTDAYMLYDYSSEIHFLGEFLEKRVVCKDMNGNEYTGDFVSVADDFKESRFLRVVLEKVEKKSEGKTVQHVDRVYVDDIASLRLAD